MACELSNSLFDPQAVVLQPDSPHPEGQIAGSAARGTSTDLESWLKGHLCRADAGGYEDRMRDFLQLQNGFSDHEAILLLLRSSKNNTHSHLGHREKMNCSLLVRWAERRWAGYRATTLENIPVL